jgi:hypothetical protein
MMPYASCSFGEPHLRHTRCSLPDIILIPPEPDCLVSKNPFLIGRAGYRFGRIRLINPGRYIGAGTSGGIVRTRGVHRGNRTDQLGAAV